MRHIQQFIILSVCSQLTIIWVHRFVIIDYNSYHLWKCECWIRQERKMRTIFFPHTDRERINSSYFNIFFSCLFSKKVQNCCLLWDISLPESQPVSFFFSFMMKHKKGGPRNPLLFTVHSVTKSRIKYNRLFINCQNCLYNKWRGSYNLDVNLHYALFNELNNEGL